MNQSRARLAYSVRAGTNPPHQINTALVIITAAEAFTRNLQDLCIYIRVHGESQVRPVKCELGHH